MTDLPGRYKIEAIIVISNHVLRRSYGYIALNASELVQDPILPFAEAISGPYVSLTFERREVLKTLHFGVFGQTQCNGQNGSQVFFFGSWERRSRDFRGQQVPLTSTPSGIPRSNRK